jgi:hypothetical protein
MSEASVRITHVNGIDRNEGDILIQSPTGAGPTPPPITASGTVNIPGNTVSCLLTGPCIDTRNVVARGNRWDVTFVCQAFGHYHLSVTGVAVPEPPDNVSFDVRPAPRLPEVVS